MTYMAKSHRFAGAALAVAVDMTYTAPLTAEAAIVGERAIRGAVVGAAIGETTNGDLAQRAAIGAAAGAVAGAVSKQAPRSDKAADRSPESETSPITAVALIVSGDIDLPPDGARTEDRARG